jgi:LysM repeat protein
MSAPLPPLPPTITSQTVELPAYQPGVFIDVASPDLASPTRGIRPRKRSRLQTFLIGLSGGTVLIIVGGVLALATLLSPIGARRAARVLADEELKSELTDGEQVKSRAYVSQRNWWDNFRESFGVLVATDRRLIFVGVPPAPWIRQTDDGPPELRVQTFSYDVPFRPEYKRLFLATTPGVVVHTAGGNVSFMVARGERTSAREIERVVERALYAITEATQSELAASRPAPAPATVYVTHIVRYGEAVSSIARRYRTTPDVIRQLNRLTRDNIRAGQRLRVPALPDSTPAPGAPNAATPGLRPSSQ